jgi:hypothetical protein
MTRFSIFVASAALMTVSAASAQPSPQGATGELAARLLMAHNRERAAVGAPPLEWDQTLADHAASYGPVLASLGRLVHSPRESRPGERENLAMAWHGTMSPEELVGMWSRERQLLEPGSYLFPGASRTGNWEDIAHYTQRCGRRRRTSAARSISPTGTISSAAIRRRAIRTASRCSSPPHLAMAVEQGGEHYSFLQLR